MKTKKFSIEVIEQGRLTKEEANEITGGIIGGVSSVSSVSGWGSVGLSSSVSIGLISATTAYRPYCQNESTGGYVVTACAVYVACEQLYVNCPTGQHPINSGPYTVCSVGIFLGRD